MKRTTAKTIDEYLDLLPADTKVALAKVRNAIRQAAPDAEETISYQIPTFKQNGMLVGFAAFTSHCSFFVMSPKLMKNFTKELKDYKTATATIQFSIDKPLPATLIKKIVVARLKENEELAAARKAGKALHRSSKEATEIAAYLKRLDHPLKAELAALREIIKKAAPQLSERIKWNAPSYYLQEDLFTFNLHNPKLIHLIFHHKTIVKIKSPLLEGDYKDRRIAQFHSMKDVEAAKKELTRVIKELLGISMKK